MNCTGNRGRSAAACVIGLALLGALTSEVTAQQSGDPSVAEGARVYGNMCGTCHNARSPLERSDRDWVTIANHMRVRANLTGDQVRSVLAFLQATNTDPREKVQLSGGQAAAVDAMGAAPEEQEIPSDPQVIASGKAFVEQKACLGCHVVGNAGGRVGPSLNGSVSRRGASFVRRKMADPTFDNATSMMPNLGLSAEQIEAILAYLNTLNGK